MGKGLGKTELTGLILLAILVVAITGCAFLVKGCSGPSVADPVEIRVLDTVPVPAPTVALEAGKETGTKKSKDTKANKKRKSKKGRKKKNATAVEPRPNPFQDTIPRE